MWQALKEATDKVRLKREEFLKEYEVVLNDNLAQKTVLSEKMLGYESLNSDSISDWKTWTDEVMKLQEDWKKIGPIPRDSESNASNSFWNAARTFFNAKRAFFAKLDSERSENLKKKEELCERVEALKESDNFTDTANEIKRLQAEWKKVGRAPKAQNESIYQRFRAACDHFFNRRSEHFSAVDSEYENNYKQKTELIGSIQSLGTDASKEDFEALTAKFFEIGYVPREKVREVQKSFSDACHAYIDGLELDDQAAQEMKIAVELGSVKGTAQEAEFKKKKSHGIRQKIGKINDEIATYNNNLEFFAQSKNIDSIKKDVDEKVAVLKKELAELKQQLALLK